MNSLVRYTLVTFDATAKEALEAAEGLGLEVQSVVPTALEGEYIVHGELLAKDAEDRSSFEADLNAAMKVKRNRVHLSWWHRHDQV